MRSRRLDSTEGSRAIHAALLAHLRAVIADSGLAQKQVAAEVWPHLTLDNAERALSGCLAGREPLTVERMAAIYALCHATPRAPESAVQESLADVRAQLRDIQRRLEALMERSAPRPEPQRRISA